MYEIVSDPIGVLIRVYRSNRIFDRYAGRLDLITIDLDRLTRLDSRRLHDRGSVGKLADPDETIANAVR